MRQKIQTFFIGRNGFDEFCRFLNWVSIGFILLSIIFKGVFSVVCYLLAFTTLFYTYYRALSKKVYVRMGENSRFLSAKSRVMGSVKGAKDRFSQRKDFKFFTCPSCHTKLRVPRGKGKIIMTCRKCGNRFEGKS